ncbi:site-specific integrase, partial [Arachidicoccus ginsenosidivorans]
GDIDFERSRLHVRESKRNKDRCIPTSKGVLGKLKTHLDYWSPQKFVFEDLKCSGRAIPIAGINQVLKADVKAAGITKNVKGDLVFTTHTSRKNIFFYGSTMQ